MGRKTVSHLLLAVAVPAALPAAGLSANPASGPLRVHPESPRYLADGSGKPVYLTGSHIWNSIQDWGTTDPPDPLDYPAFLDFLVRHSHTFTRLWHWEHARWVAWTDLDCFITPLPYARTGPGQALDGRLKFDLTRFDEAFFDRLRQRVELAQQRGLYVGVMLFQGFSTEGKGKQGRPFRGHPFHRDNNVNHIDGDPNHDDQGQEVHELRHPAITAIQEAYVRKTIDTLNDLDNVIWEIGNELHRDSVPWQYHMIQVIQRCESTKPKQHPVWMTVPWEPGDNTRNSAALFASSAQLVSPNHRTAGQNYRADPPEADGSKVVVPDTDHLWGIGGTPDWVWRCFTRGLNPIFMDPRWGIPHYPVGRKGDESQCEPVRKAMGATSRCSRRLDLRQARPQGRKETEPSSTRYCLYEPGRVYVVYAPAGESFTVRLDAGAYRQLWLDPLTGKPSGREEEIVADATAVRLTPPRQGRAVLVLERVGDGR